MLSRAASSIYWMCRYLERADNVARFIDVNATLILDGETERDNAQWMPLVNASGDEKDFVARYGEPEESNVIQFLTFDDDNPNSIISCVQYARENARTVREIISTETWETINALYHLVRKHSRKRRIDDLQGFLGEIHNATHSLTGLMENTMSHGEAWQFANMGRMLERADKTARMLDVKYFLLLPSADYFDSPYDTVEWGAVLKSASGFEMYCKQFHRANFRDVTQFLVLDNDFPRSIRHCINTASTSLKHVTKLLNVSVPVSQEMATLKSSLDNATLESILEAGLHEFVDVFQYNLNVVDKALYDSFFSLEKSAQKLAQ